MERQSDWGRISSELDAFGCSVIKDLLAPAHCEALSALYDEDGPFRSRVVMARHGFGLGEYKYFRYPLPDLIERLRTGLYPELARVANRWHTRLSAATRFPAEHAAFLRRCHRAGQRRPTPLLLKYQAGDYNCLHQDLYGEHVFPLQLTVLLSQPGTEFDGGEFVMRSSARACSRAPRWCPFRGATRWCSR